MKIFKPWKAISYLFIFLFFALLVVLTGSIINDYQDNLLKYAGLNYVIKEKKVCPDCVRRLLDGVLVPPGEKNFYPVAIIIDNHIDSRPAYGLEYANLVYEAEAEGGITRYLAFFTSSDEIKKIGPIRSSRPYFIDWTKELSAVFMHCGGSPEALVKAKQEQIIDVNEFYNGSYYWRDQAHPAPHNIFTSTSNINEYLEKKKLAAGKFISWKYKNDNKITANTKANTNSVSTKNIIINFNRPGFSVEWVYDEINNKYIYNLAGEEYETGDGNKIKANNIILQFMDSKVIDEEYRLKIDTIGSGRAVICLDGKCQAGEWKKSSASSRTRYYYNQNDEEVRFNPGTTWIEVITTGTEIEY